MLYIQTYQQRSFDWELTTILNEQEVVLRVTWNNRGQYFFLSLTDPFGQTVSSIRVVPKQLLLRQRRGSIEFFGDIVCLKVDENEGDLITYDNFGSGYQLIYLTPDEVETFQEELVI